MYSLAKLILDMAVERSYLSKMISEEVADEFNDDFTQIVVKIKYKMPLSEQETKRVMYLYNRYHGTAEIVLSKQVVENLYV